MPRSFKWQTPFHMLKGSWVHIGKTSKFTSWWTYYTCLVLTPSHQGIQFLSTKSPCSIWCSQWSRSMNFILFIIQYIPHLANPSFRNGQFILWNYRLEVSFTHFIDKDKNCSSYGLGWHLFHWHETLWRSKTSSLSHGWYFSFLSIQPCYFIFHYYIVRLRSFS